MSLEPISTSPAQAVLPNAPIASAEVVSWQSMQSAVGEAAEAQAGPGRAGQVPVVAIIGPGAHGQQDTGLNLTAMSLGQSPLRLIGPGSCDPALKAAIATSGQIRSNANNLQFSTPGIVTTQDGSALTRGIAPAGVLNSATLSPHQNAGIVYNTLQPGAALDRQFGSLPAGALLVNTDDPVRTTQTVAILRPDLLHTYGSIDPASIATVNGVPDLFGAGSANSDAANRVIWEPKAGVAAMGEALAARELARAITAGGNGASIAAVPLDAGAAAFLSAHVSSRTGQSIDIPAGTVIAAPVSHATGGVDLEGLLASVDIDPRRAAQILQGLILARTDAAETVAQSIQARGEPMTGDEVLADPSRALSGLGSKVPSLGARAGNDAPYAAVPAGEYSAVLGKVAVVSATGNIGELQLAQLLGNGVDATAVSRGKPAAMPAHVPWSSQVPENTDTVFLTASQPTQFMPDGSADRAALLAGNLDQIIVPQANQLPQGATVVVTTNPTNELVSALKALRPDLNVIGDSYSDLARANMFSALRPMTQASIVLGPHNPNMIVAGPDGSQIAAVPDYGVTIARLSRSPDGSPQASTLPTGAAAINGAVNALSGRPYLSAPVLGEANAAVLSELIGMHVDPHISFAAPYTFDPAVKSWTIDAGAIAQFLAGAPGLPTSTVLSEMTDFIAQTAVRNLQPAALATAVNQAFGTAITARDAAELVNGPAVRLAMVQNAVQGQNQFWDITANQLADMIAANHPEIGPDTARRLIDEGGTLPDGRDAKQLLIRA